MSISGNVTLALALASLCGLAYNIIFYEALRPKVLVFGDISGILDKMEIYFGISFLIILLFHISAILTLGFQLKFFKKENLLRAFIFFMAIISMLLVLADFALLGDIGKEHAAGLDTSGEWPVLYFSQAFHFVFIFFLLVLLFFTRRSVLNKYREERVVKDEATFINAQYIGIFCGVFGIGVFSWMSASMPLWAIKKGIFVMSLIIVLPYIILAAYWLAMKIKEKTWQWYDEKQFQDISKASLVTMVLSIIIMLAIFLVQYFNEAFDFVAIIWFPFYIFLVLLIFSSSTLYFNKKAVDLSTLFICFLVLVGIMLLRSRTLIRIFYSGLKKAFHFWISNRGNNNKKTFRILLQF